MAVYDWQFMGDKADRSKHPMANKRKYRKAIPLQDVPKLPGWMTLDEAAEYIGITKMGLWKQVFDAYAFLTVHYIGARTHPTYLIAFEEVLAYKEQRLERLKLREENKRIREMLKQAEFPDEHDYEEEDESSDGEED